MDDQVANGPIMKAYREWLEKAIFEHLSGTQGLSKEQILLTKLKESKVAKVSKEEESDFQYQVVDFERCGTKMVLPEKMGYEEAIHHLKLKIKEEETEVRIVEEVNAFPYDGAFMLMRVLQGRYGWASPVPKMTFFGPKPPEMRGLEIAPGKFTQIIWGEFAMPGIEGTLETGAADKDGRLIFMITGVVKKKHEHEVRAIAEEVRTRIKEESIYKGMGIRLSTDDDGDIEQEAAPKFIDVRAVREEELVLPTNVEEEVRTSIWAPIEKTEMCRENRVPLKMGILLEGPFGTGKTLTAFVTAKKCVQNRWTFIYLDRVSGLKAALEFARQYQPAVVFAEDIDRVVEGQERTEDIDDVLNTIDGIESKGTEIMTVLTTNDVKKINRAMLRPGRLDAVISVPPPDREAAERLMRIYARDLIPTTEKLVQASKELDGHIPATIREVVERSKRSAISRLHPGETFSLKDADLAKAAKSMKHHMELMKPEAEEEPSSEELLGISFREIVEDIVTGRRVQGQVVLPINGGIRGTVEAGLT